VADSLAWPTRLSSTLVLSHVYYSYIISNKLKVYNSFSKAKSKLELLISY